MTVGFATIGAESTLLEGDTVGVEFATASREDVEATAVAGAGAGTVFAIPSKGASTVTGPPISKVGLAFTTKGSVL